MPPRYLVADDDRKSGCGTLLRFPPGVTLEDAGVVWELLGRTRVLPSGALERLRDLGVEAVANVTFLDARWRVMSRNRRAAPASFAEDYLDINARLGGERCVSVPGYAMDTYACREPLRASLLEHLRERDDVRVYGTAAFRVRDLPDTLSLRVDDIFDTELGRDTFALIPCRLHGDGARDCPFRTLDPCRPIYYSVDYLYRYERVPVPRRLLDELAAARNDRDPRRVAQSALAVALRILDALPGGAAGRGGAARSYRRRGLASLVALAVAETCEEHEMLAGALQRCRSLREMERRVRDASWAVSRTLEGLLDRR